MVDFDLTAADWNDSQSLSDEPEVLLVKKSKNLPTSNVIPPGECLSITLYALQQNSDISSVFNNTPSTANEVPVANIDINLRDLPLINFWQSVFNHDPSLHDTAKKFAQHGLSQEDIKEIDDYIISKITDNLKIHVQVRKAIQNYLYVLTPP